MSNWLNKILRNTKDLSMYIDILVICNSLHEGTLGARTKISYLMFIILLQNAVDWLVNQSQFIYFT